MTESSFGGPALLYTAGILMHEMMHAFQYPYLLYSGDYNEYEWFMESSANWAIHYISPGLDLEHGSGVRQFLETPHLSLNDMTANRHHSYLWPLFLAEEHYPGLIKDIIENFEIQPSLEANDIALKDAWSSYYTKQILRMVKNVIALAAILRKYTKDQWITTNCMASYMPVDPWRSDFLDYISWTAYPVSGYNEGIGRKVSEESALR